MSRAFSAAFFLLLLSFCLFAAPIRIYPYVLPYVHENESFSSEMAWENENSQLHLVRFEGSIGMIMQVENPGKTAQKAYPIEKKSDISEALSKYYDSLLLKEKALAAVEDGHAAVQYIGEARLKPEKECRRLMGTDTHECNGEDSCQKACYSVTSFCMQIALGTGKHFIGYIWDMENRTKSLAAGLAAENFSYNLLKANFTPQGVFAYRSAFFSINRDASAIIANPLQNWLCPMPNFDMGRLTNAGQAIIVASDEYAQVGRISFDSVKIANATAARVAYLKNKIEGEAAGKNNGMNGTGNSSIASPASKNAARGNGSQSAAIPSGQDSFSPKITAQTPYELKIILFILFVVFGIGALAFYSKVKRGKENDANQ